jgi:hypothetical protein
MEDKLDKILNELKVVKENQAEIKMIVNAVRESQEITNARTTTLENIQERQQLVIETLSYRSIQQETDIKDIKRKIQNQ